MFKIKNRRTGEKVTIREFFRQVNQGIKNMTPYQQTISIQFGQVTSLIGVVWGIIFSIMLGYWWMALILVGGVIVLVTQMIGNSQRKAQLKKHEDAIREAEKYLMEENQIQTETKEGS